MASSCREALPKGRELLVGTLGGPGVVGRYSQRVGRHCQRAESDQDAPWRAGNGREALMEDRGDQEVLPECRKWS